MSVRTALPLLATSLLACPGAYAVEAACVQLDETIPQIEPSDDPRLLLDADRVDLDVDGRSELEGSVRLRFGDREFTTEKLSYDERERRVEVGAPSVFRNGDLTIRSQSADFDLDAETGRFDGASFVLPERAARGESGRIELDAEGTARLDAARYTTCAPQSDAWYLEAGSIRLDHDEGLGTARNARLRFFGVPILYAPWFQFPIDDRRRTGLLFPTFGESSKTGFDVRQPVYFNLAPNYDATLTPRYMSERGLQLDADGRYLLRRSEGRVGYEVLEDRELDDETRAYTELEHRGLLTRQLGVDIRYADVSDPAYFEDLGGSIDLSSITHLERSARFTYNAPASYTVQALFQDYQTIASNLEPVDDPYRRLPQLRIDAITRNAILDTRLGGSAEYVNFVRSDSIEGQRFDLHPYLRMEKDRVAWFVKSQLDFRYTTYELTGTEPGRNQQVDRALPQFSAEYGLRFERVTRSGALQTLEPRLFYLYIPYENQDDVPVFDSGEPDFDLTQLFARNRFSGEDRISDANQFAGAVTVRQLDPDSGVVRASASFGQLFRFQTPRVRLPDEPAPDRGATDFIGIVDYRLLDNWTLRLDTQWSPESADFTRTSAAVRFRTERRYLEVAYRFREDLLEQTDLLLSTPLAAGFSLLGRWRYSVRDDNSLDALAGVRYETCCWAVATSYRRYVADTQGRFNTGVYLQLELKGLARLGSGVSNLFPAGVVE
ncbi:LPS-assembly protein LptD [Sinimarinibacterium flocculans]|uniref:LPS-assembly protein LptD n=1 Tax=Sinimarinibacterium flocculans TaxID=985250 RepID=A0A318EHE2_9GAMM|nr:LPS assembly protein LptD [Sinimarinibacterium flocculans]PXV70225.1 LPS-assembly protein [Sinimarinibacterium flocculans]